MRLKSPWVGIAIVLLLLLAPLPLGPLARNWLALTNTIENAGHPLVFWWLTSRLLAAVRSRLSSRPATYSLTLALAVVLGLATEFVQSLVGRDASWEDACYDAIGAAFALAMQARRDLNTAGKTTWRPVATLLAIGFAGIAAFPVTWTSAAYLWRWLAFPMLWSPDSILATRFSYWKRDAYPGLVVDEPARDWRGYSSLQVHIRSLRSTGTEVRIRVHDQKHNQQFGDRFNKTFVLPDARERVLTIPLAAIQRSPAARDLDLSAVRGIIIFQEGQRAPLRFEVGEIRLVR